MTQSMTGSAAKAKYRARLPQLEGGFLLTDGGLETTLIFHEGIDLPYFAAFDLMRTIDGRAALEAYYRRYAELARAAGRGFVMETPTWRASRDWGALLGYSPEALAIVNQEAVAMLRGLREEYDSEATPFVVSGNLGPRGDGYNPKSRMRADEAEAYHAEQIGALAAAGADMIAALTLNYVDEAVGVARAARAAGMPVALAFTVETDGRLPTGQSLGEAIEQVDRETDGAPAYYMINCAHPDHFQDALTRGAGWLERIRGLRANASRMSHAELDESETLDDGDPDELGAQYRALMEILPNLAVLGGCCGTDHRHVHAIGAACAGKRAA